jgi:hypothetical protein
VIRGRAAACESEDALACKYPGVGLSAFVRQWVPIAIATSLSVIFALTTVEIGLRASGHGPWRSLRTRPGEPTFHDPDPDLGWILRAGHWQYGPYATGGTPIEVTISSDRSRRTRLDPGDDAGSPRPQVLLVGCSFTFGWGVSDDETWAWGLQALRPDLDVRNRGTAAYGTFQALLLLERLLASGERPAHVIYGFIPDHGVRNVAAPGWMKALGMFTGQNIVEFPYCELDRDGRLVRHPPESYPVWPLREWSATMTFLQDSWFDFEGRTRAAGADEVTRRLIAEMDDRCRKAGIPFSLLLLRVGPSRRDAFVPFARTHGIDLIDCDRALGRGDFVPGDLHPNARVHRTWAACVADGLVGRT